MASVLVLAFAREAFAADEAASSGGVSLGAASASGNASYQSFYDYAGSVVFTMDYRGEQPVTNFPLCIRLARHSPEGFDYTLCKNGSDDLTFFDTTGQVLDHEVEKWDAGGTSILWVRVPLMRKGEKVTMCWNLRDGCKPAENDPTKVWSDYAGVWHMGETISSANAATTYSADSTGHGLDAKPMSGQEGNASVMTSTVGVFGNGRVNDTAAHKGSFLAVEDVDGQLDIGDTFTISLWVKIVDYVTGGYPQIVTRRQDGNTQNGYQVHLGGQNQRNYFAIRGKGADPKAELKATEANFKDIPGYTHVAFVYEGTTVTLYANGLRKGTGTIGAVNDVPGDWMGIGNRKDGTEQSLWGRYDEVRLCKGAKGADWIAAEHEQGTNALYTAGAVTNDAKAVLRNDWVEEPSITKTTWDADGALPTSDDFTFTPKHNENLAEKFFYDRTTGKLLGVDVPKAVGEYRVVFTVPERDGWGALEYTIDFRIVRNGGTHDFGINIDRVLLANDDDSVDGGEVTGQSYNDEIQDDDVPFWKHLADDHETDDSSTPPSEEEMDDWSVSWDYNFGGGTYHEYWYRKNRLWTLDGVRIGNTFLRNDRTQGTGGLARNQNYLPWNPDSLRVVNFADDSVGQWRRYAGHILMQNKKGAQVVSSCYTNGIGTIYFDAVNGWTENVWDSEGNNNYQIVVEVATNCVGSARPPTDAAISSNPGEGAKAYDQFLYADWKQFPMRVLRFDGDQCTDLGTRAVLNLDIEDGGSCKVFYRVIVPVDTLNAARFRIRRVTMANDPTQVLNPDGDALILMDNVICSKPAPRAVMKPYGRYDETKTGKEIAGWEGAFTPAFPSMTDAQVYGRAKATLSDGSAIPDGFVAAAAMHYRWHYLGQRETDWKVIDLDPKKFVSVRPLDLPLGFQGDVEFWFDANQNGYYYEYADYSGAGLYLGTSGYTEEVSSVTNRASGADWFVRTREGKGDYADMKILVKTSENGPAKEYGMWVSDNRLWRGYYKMDKALKDGFWWRIEPRDRQEDGATAWNASTNYWYVLDWKDDLPEFPATGRMSEGGANSWCRMPCDKQTGYLMFQVDETSRGVTVIHADYQNFNDWNDAAGYFTGSSAETNEMSGTSSNVRTYDELYAGWKSMQATDDDWNFFLTNKTQVIGAADYPGYKQFSKKDDAAAAWDIGKGMWVYGKYREPESHVAYQMAGCGEGYAEFVKKSRLGDNWPRGIDTVSFQARLAQPVSPEYAALYEPILGAPATTNYAFMARTCFDMNRNENFAGNASLSLFAYQSRRGAYEARWEQIKGMATSNDYYKTEYLGPKKTGQRLVILRWTMSGSSYAWEELIAVTNDGTWNVEMPLMPYAEGSTATNNLMPFMISAYQTERNGPTYIVAGVRFKSESKKGVSADEDIPVYRPGTGSGDWYFVTYKDTSASRLKNGTYGVLSSNCEGMFVRPQFCAQPAWPSNVKTAKEVKNEQLKQYRLVTTTDDPDFADCRDAMLDDDWAAWPGRTEAFFGDGADYGFTYAALKQKINIYASPVGANKWTLIGDVPVEDFGQPYKQPNCVTNLCLTDDCELRLETGGTLNDYRVDVVISDIVISQWRGRDDWKTSANDWNFTTDTYKSSNRFGATNIVFTGGWVTDGAVRLSARRAEADKACSVRSPLFDGVSQSGWGYRSVGLGQIAIRYREPQENVRLKVQVVTNYTGVANLDKISRSIAEGNGNESNWHTVTNLTYAMLTTPSQSCSWDAEKREGVWTTYLGWHGAKGMMRVTVDDKLVKELANETDPDKFGEIDVLEVTCKDEPALDKGCWWGWNLKTVGDFYDTEKRMFLPDGAKTTADSGQSMALNNSTTDDTNPAEDPEDFKKHLPFVQSPTFDSALIGQISFKARKFDLSDRSPEAKVVVYGAAKNPDELSKDADWTFVEEFPITNTLYATYTCKTAGQKYYALRLAVLINGTDNPPDEAKGVKNPQRILLDEVMVSEAVNAMLSFRNVGAFRSDLEKNTYVEGVTTRDEQPLCDENWGVQAELFATMLADEIDTSYTPKVKLHWYVGDEPWGYANWKSIPTDKKNRTRGSAYLAQVEGSNYVYRSSYKEAPDAVLPAQPTNVVVQYMLEVEYKVINSAKGTKVLTTNWLDSVSWSTPEWYAPVDYNADAEHGAGLSFAAYTILDTVAPGWAWINEMNIFGLRKSGGGNSEQSSQFVEVCVPAEVDLTGWKVRMLDATLDGMVVTNNVATFGVGKLAGRKKDNYGLRYGMVFRSIGAKEGGDLKYYDTLDAPWTFSQLTDTFMKNTTEGYYYVDYQQPFGVQLVRSSGIIEHSIVVVGTNRWGQSRGQYHPTNYVAILNRSVPGSRFFYAGEDCCGEKRTDSVMCGQGESPSVWTNNWVATPGNLNHGPDGTEQTIGDHPSPHGDSIIVYTSVDTTLGHIKYEVGSGGKTAEPQMFVLKRGSDTGTNITFYADAWYEVASVTTNGAPFWKYERCQPSVKVTVGVGASNNLYVVGAAKVNSDLAEKYGLTEDNPFTPAVMDWLEGGETLKGEFEDPGKIYLADYAGLDGVVVTNLSLTQMYCLDMDPTVSNMLFQADLTGEIGPAYRRENTLTNVQVKIFMMITNRTAGASEPVAWSPYVLRGLAPGSHSWQYKNAAWTNETISAWTSETFKVTGILLNGHTSEKNPNNYIPLNWFVFHEDSFYQPEDEPQHARYTAEIEVLDPHSQSSPGADSGWKDWFINHPDDLIGWSWAIDMRLRPRGVEVLQKNNYWEE